MAIKLNNLPEQVLFVVILQFAKIEDIVSLERISPKFRRVVDTILKERKQLTIHEHSDESTHLTIVLNLVKRMPNLISIECINEQNGLYQPTHGRQTNENKYRFVSELAAINQNIQKLTFPSISAMAIEYVKCVKKLNADYDGAHFKEVFHFNGCGYDSCLERYPNLKLMTFLKAELLDGCRHKHLINHLLLYSYDTMNEPLPSVEVVEVVHLDFYHIRDVCQCIRLLPNMKKLHLRIECNYAINEFNLILDHVDSRFVEYLTIEGDRCQQPDEHFADKIGTFIRSKPLKNVIIRMKLKNRELFHGLVNMLVDVTNVHGHHLKEFEVICVRNGGQSLSLKKNYLEYKLCPSFLIEDVNIVNQVLISYPKVNHVVITFQHPVVNVLDIKWDCDGFAAANHKRFVKLIILDQPVYPLYSLPNYNCCQCSIPHS